MTRPTTAAEAIDRINDGGAESVKLAVTDIDGVMRGKYVSVDKFRSAAEKGMGFCDVVLGWDSRDQLYDNVQLTGWHTAYPDAELRILPDTMRRIPSEDGLPLFLMEFADKWEAACPRGTLRRVLDRADGMGFRVDAAAEFEFFLFAETPHSLREKGFRDLTPITPDFFGYSMLRSGLYSEAYHELLGLARDMEFDIEGLHTETGPGVLEAAIGVTGALEAADRAALFKTFVKIWAQRRGWLATFMARWSPDWPGQSGHLHISLKDRDGGTVFRDGDAGHGISDTMRWFIGGQQKLMPELLAMAAPTVNSFSRLVPGFWAPTAASWGIENRTCALRAIPGSDASQRVEYRITAADINPYIALAAAVGSGLWGIEHRIEPEAPADGSAYDMEFPDHLKFPATLSEAAEGLKQSEAARALFGDGFVEHYAATRLWEEREFRRHISDWELSRYFEII